MFTRTETIQFNDFLSGEYKRSKTDKTPVKVISSALSLSLITNPVYIFAAEQTGDEAFNKIYDQVLKIFDYGVVFVFVFSGALWMFNNQSKAIQYMIGGSIGYFIVRHADDIQRFLSGL